MNQIILFIQKKKYRLVEKISIVYHMYIIINFLLLIENKTNMTVEKLYDY